MRLYFPRILFYWLLCKEEVISFRIHWLDLEIGPMKDAYEDTQDAELMSEIGYLEQRSNDLRRRRNNLNKELDDLEKSIQDMHPA